MDAYLEGTEIGPDVTADLIRSRSCFPVIFGSALKDIHVDRLMETMDRFMTEPERKEGTQEGIRGQSLQDHPG